jgi:hypothetical protein
VDLGTLLTAVIGGVIGGAFTLAGQYLNAQLTRKREERQRMIEALLASVDATYAVRRVFDYRRLGTTQIQGRLELDDALTELRRALVPVADRELRKRFVFIFEALSYTSAIAAFGHTPQISAGHLLCQHAVDLLEKRLHGDPLPDEPKSFASYRRAMAEADEAADEAQARRSQLSFVV